MRILGISAFYHDSAAALLVDGRIVGGGAGGALHAQEAGRALSGPRDRLLPRGSRHRAQGRRLCRVLREAVPEIRAAAGNLSRRLRRAASSRSPWRSRSGSARSCSRRTSCCASCKSIDPDFDWPNRLLFTEHHVSHAASAFYASPFEEAVVLTMDGVGEWCTDVGRGRPRQRAHDAQGAAFPAFARAALFRLHLLHRVQGQFRRIQADGARALWRAEIQVAASSIT